MIKAIGIEKSYENLKVLKGVHVNINPGEIVSIVGASGAGKSTLLHIMGTIDNPDSGSLSINNTEITRLSPKELSAFRNQHIGFVFQFHHLLPEFTAIENVLIPAMIAKLNIKANKERAKELLSYLGLSKRLQHKPNELSGGEQQRVAIARAIINQPKVIFADEPTGNLDSENSEDIHQLFFDLRKQFNHTFVIVTHNETLAEMADRKLVMKDGIII